MSKAWGKVPASAKSTPGHRQHRIARPYYAETLALLLSALPSRTRGRRPPEGRGASAWGRAS
ncbi:MAG: hypothetical protein U1F49_12045 [Rubrivivax sp.]